MKFESRKLYSHGQNEGVFLLSIPKLICQNMNLTKDTLITLDYNETKNSITIKKMEAMSE